MKINDKILTITWVGRFQSLIQVTFTILKLCIDKLYIYFIGTIFRHIALLVIQRYYAKIRICGTPLVLYMMIVYGVYMTTKVSDSGYELGTNGQGQIYMHLKSVLWAETQMSHEIRFPTMWYVRPAKPQLSLRMRAA